MQCELLYGKFNTKETTVEGVAFIKIMLGGGSPQYAEAFKLALRHGFSVGTPQKLDWPFT